MAKPKTNKNSFDENKALTKGEAIADPAQVAASQKTLEGFKSKRVLTLPSLAIKNSGETHVLKILDQMRVSTIETKKGDAAQKPATICTVTEMTTGENMIYILAKVVESNLQREYPEHAYVGKFFHITNKGKRKPDQSYNDFSIVEVEPA